MIFVQRIVPLLFVWNLAACVGVPAKVDLAAEARNEIDAVAVSVAVPPRPIYAQIRHSTIAIATLGGAIPMLIDAAIDARRARTQEELIEPIRNALSDYDYATVLARELERELGKIEWFRVSGVEIDRVGAEDRFDRKTRGATADAVLFVTVDYALTPDLAGLEVQAEFEMLPGIESLHAYTVKPVDKNQPLDKTHTIFRDKVSTHVLLDVADDREENARLLSESGGQVVRHALDESAVTIASRLFGVLQAIDE